ncbi:MAG: UDP-N-acetylglucosamine 2-epimerase (hydrolyzing), partial [Candidatus Omnitrophica bacterium]|nr:UDP-N-acetylglucosamine 2-epimerase (hydrolyzing) [Candidatus Omnitrophota bacterium]
KGEIKEKLGLNLEKPTILFVQHPITTNVSAVEKEFTETLEALKEIGMQTILVYPNADAGGLKAI